MFSSSNLLSSGEIKFLLYNQLSNLALYSLLGGMFFYNDMGYKSMLYGLCVGFIVDIVVYIAFKHIMNARNRKYFQAYAEVLYERGYNDPRDEELEKIKASVPIATKRTSN